MDCKKCESEKEEILQVLENLTQYYTAENFKRAKAILKKHNVE